ncbi:MAG: serine hydrolase [Bacteriovoracaceae bacterium]
MDKFQELINEHLPLGPMDALAVGVVDFKKKSFQTVEGSYYEGEIYFHDESFLWFDLASLTKPLTNSLSYFLKPELFTPQMKLCLNHRGGLPSWGRLSKTNWREQILSYPVKESETLYSDFSALRVMLELEKQHINQHELVKSVWDKELCFWKDVPAEAEIVLNGLKQVVHDPNALVIDEFCSHAGLFSTINGLCQTLINFQEKTSFIEEMKHHDQHRFYHGWDRVLNPNNTLAGNGCGEHTFGHLGFTGTSIWIDPDKMLGHVILSNTTKNHWFDKENLNEFRRRVGEIVWG